MMIIKTITCHDVYNIGASLQAYALVSYLQSLGHEVQIIDYKPDYLSGHYRLWGGVNPAYDKPLIRQIYCLAKFPGRLGRRFGKRKREFDKFTKQYLPLTRRYSSYQELEQDPPEADVYIAGSDQIWNTIFKNGRDPAFYLEFAPEKSVRASYAASFATDKIADGWSDSVAKWLSNLDYISVRESEGLNILNNLGVERGIQVLDPVFLQDAAFWSGFASDWNNPIKQPYVLLYDFDGNKDMAEFAKQIAQKNKWTVVSVLNNPYVKENFSDEGPIAFVSLVMSAEAVVSNSFHATAFSLIFHKELWVFDRNENINSRMRDLMELVGLKERIGNVTITSSPINYYTVQSIVDSMIAESVSYLATVLRRE